MSDNPFLKEFIPYNSDLSKVLDLTQKKGREKHADTLDFLRGYYIFVNFLVDEKNIFNEMPEGFKVLLSKGSLDLFAIYNTLSSGCMNQSLTLIRSLFESSVYLTYINRDFDSMMQYYHNYQYFTGYHKWKQNKDLFNSSPKEIERIVKIYNRVKNDYKLGGNWYDTPLLKDIENNPALFPNKANKKQRATFRAMCIITEQEENYKKLYSTMSESVHGSSLIGSLFINEQKNISMAPSFDSFYIESSTAFAILFLHNMISVGLNIINEKSPKQEYQNYLKYSKLYAEHAFKETDL